MNAQAGAHGMGHDLVVPRWPALQLDDVETILQAYPQAGRPLDLRWHSPRPFSSAALVRTDRTELFVKRHHHRLRQAGDLAEEHAFVKHLARHALPVPQWLQDQSGHTARQVGDWACEVQYIAEGEDWYRDRHSWTAYRSTREAEAAGEALAQLHVAAADFVRPPRRSRLLVNNFRLFGASGTLTALQAELDVRPALADYLAPREWRQDLQQHLLDPYQRQLLAQLPSYPALWTHGDWHGSNLLWRTTPQGPKVQSILDFGLSDRSFALFDLATAIERALIPWLDLDEGGTTVAELDQLDALLHGYTRVQPVTAAQLRQLACLLPLAHADFALSEVEYFAGIAEDPASADIAYHRYLLGHADWFGSAEGQRLTAHLQTMARRAA